MTSDRRSYVHGLATGMVSAAVAALVIPLFFRRCKPSAEKVMRTEYKSPAERAGLKFVSRRDSPESAGDPLAVAGMGFNRPGGAPGPRSQAEKLSMPGRPGQNLDYSDSSQSVKVARRSLNVMDKQN